MKQREKATVGKKRWASYAVAGAAAAVAGGQTAEADIYHFDVNQSIGGSGFETVNLNLGSGSSATLRFGHLAGGSTGEAVVKLLTGAAGSVRGFTTGYFSTFTYASALNAGNVVSAGPFGVDKNVYGGLANPFSGGYDQFTPGEHFVGFTFNSGGGAQYGWARVEMADDGLFNAFTVVDYAYADVGESIEAGEFNAVPEPGSLGLLALGALGMGAWRRRRQSA